jgi:hypothetical protein
VRGVGELADHTRIEEALTEARDALQEFWEQGEGAACFVALRLANDALADYRALDDAGDARLRELAAEVERLRAPLDSMPPAQ